MAYRTEDGSLLDYFPLYADEEKLTPVYKEFKGWCCDTTSCSTYDELPAELKAYIEFIEQETSVPIDIVSVGPNRTNTIIR